MEDYLALIAVNTVLIVGMLYAVFMVYVFYDFYRFSPLRYATMIWQLKRNGLSVVGTVQSSRTITYRFETQYFLTVSVNNDDSNDFVASAVIERSPECIVDANMDTGKMCMIQEYKISSKISYNQAVNTSLIEMLVDPTTFSSPWPVALPASEMDRFFRHALLFLLDLTFLPLGFWLSFWLNDIDLTPILTFIFISLFIYFVLLLRCGLLFYDDVQAERHHLSMTSVNIVDTNAAQSKIDSIM